MKNELFIDPKWIIEGYPDYFFGNDKYLYRIKNNFQARRCNKTVIGYTQGYVLKSKFFSLKRLQGMIKKNNNIQFASSYAIIERKDV